MPDLPTTADIRKFLTEAFSDDEFTTLCFDYFPQVSEGFTSGMTKWQKVQLLIEYCQRHDALPNLLAALERTRPEQFKKRFPQSAHVEVSPEPVAIARDSRQVFISYAHQDAEFAHRLADDLRAHGWRAWIAPESIYPGEKWVDAINRGLEGSSVFVLVLTPSAIKSRWVQDETNAMIELEHEGLVRFVPVEVERCDVPPLWRPYQRIPFQDYARGLTNLVYELDPEQGEGERWAKEEAARQERERQQREQAARGEAERQAREKAEVQRQERERRERAVRETEIRARLDSVPSVRAVGQPWWARRALPAWALPVAGGVLLMVVAGLAWLMGSIIAQNAASAAATQTAVAALAARAIQTATPTLAATATRPTAVAALVTVTPPMLSAGATRIAENDSAVMVYVPAGEFLMGSTDADVDSIGCDQSQLTCSRSASSSQLSSNGTP